MLASSPLTIVHVLTRLLRAGSEENTISSCRGQSAAGHKVYLVHGRDYDPGVRDRAGAVAQVIEAKALVHPVSPLADAKAVAELTRIFRAVGPDIVHTHQSKAGIVGRVAARLAGVRGVVHGVHIIPFENVSRAQALIYAGAERLCAPMTDAFISVSPSVRDAYLDRGVGAPARHFVAWSAMEVDRFKAPSPPQDWRGLLQVAEGAPKPPTALMLAAFEPRKRHAALLRETAAAFASLPDWRLLFAGEGAELAAVKALAAELGIADKVCFAGFRSDPERLIALSDVCLLTSNREGLPRVLVQYAAAGKPIVCTRIPGLEDVVSPGVDAVVVEPDDIAAAAAAVARLLADPDARARLGQASAAIDVDRWSPSRMDETIADVYGRVLASSGQGRKAAQGAEKAGSQWTA